MVSKELKRILGIPVLVAPSAALLFFIYQCSKSPVIVWENISSGDDLADVLNSVNEAMITPFGCSWDSCGDHGASKNCNFLTQLPKNCDLEGEIRIGVIYKGAVMNSRYYIYLNQDKQVKRVSEFKRTHR